MSLPARTWSLRRAEPTDAQAIRACAIAAFAVYLPRLLVVPLPMRKDYAAAIRTQQAWVAIGAPGATEAGTPGGHGPAQHRAPIVAALVLDITAEGFLIDVIAVRPEHQGSGAGRALLALAEREALAQGFDSIYLFTNEKMTESRALYQRIGYAEYRREVHEDRTRVFMRKPLR